MFTDEPLNQSPQGYPRMLPSGVWLVHVGSEQYRAWKFWLSTAFGKQFFPEPIMQVWHEFPPITQEGADRVAQAISETRNALNDDAKFRHQCRAVPRHPIPWDGGIPPAPPQGCHPREMKPWRDILRARGRAIPHDDSTLAQALDIAQEGKPRVATGTDQRRTARVIPISGAISDALRNRLGIKPPEPDYP